MWSEMRHTGGLATSTRFNELITEAIKRVDRLRVGGGGGDGDGGIKRLKQYFDVQSSTNAPLIKVPYSLSCPSVSHHRPNLGQGS